MFRLRWTDIEPSWHTVFVPTLKDALASHMNVGIYTSAVMNVVLEDPKKQGGAGWT